MQITTHGRGLNVVIEEDELRQLQAVINGYLMLPKSGYPPPKWVFMLDAALVAKRNDNAREDRTREA